MSEERGRKSIDYGNTEHRRKENQTGTPSKYPQGYFKDKGCKRCGELFSPKAPSELYCSDYCSGWVRTDNYLRGAYGIGKEKYDKLYQEQSGKCAICGGEGFAMIREDAVKMVVDHNHATGEVRGLLCHNCNRGLGLFQDDSGLLDNAKKYLDKYK